VTARCGACEKIVGDTSAYDVFNENGAAIVQICSVCEGKLTADRCAACGRRLHPGHDGFIGPHGSSNGHNPICAECRRDFISVNGGVFE